MIAIDTSLVVALFASWHEAHDAAHRAVRGDVHLPAHVLLESYSVLTRLPPPHRAPPGVVAQFLRSRFQRDLLALPADGYASLLELLRDGGITGGAAYDALVAAVVKYAGGTLLTRDRRAARSYEVVGVSYRMVS